MRLLAFVAGLLSVFAVILLACTSSSNTCANDGDCSGGQGCFFKIGTCSAQGACMTLPPGPSGAACVGSLQLYCGCNGTMVATGCGFPDGYAGGPTTGTEQADSEAPNPCPVP
jgi:hypothetical protein